MRHPTTKGLYDYWNTVRGSRLAPRRYEIEPAQIVPFLSETVILEEPASTACRIRVAGTRVSSWLGDGLRGQLFLELWNEADQIVLGDALRTITDHGGVGFFTFSAATSDSHEIAEFEMLLVPLTHLGDNIERVLGSIALTCEPEWLTTVVPSLELSHNSIIWPEGRPHALARPGSLGEVPLALTDRGQFAGIRRARLVRSDRRRFLVYDGGRDLPRDDDKPKFDR